MCSGGADEISQVEFSAKLPVSRQYLCDLEHGRRFASAKAAADYADVLGYSRSQFVRMLCKTQSIEMA